jgi:uncharacterized protein YndB with AHSA1/START domain
MAEPTLLTVAHTQLVLAPPMRVLKAFFDAKDLKDWWQVVRSVTVPRPLGMYAVEWDSTDFKDDVLGRLGGTFHGTLMDYRASGAFYTFFVAEAYWQPPDGDPIGPMALEVHCRAHGNGRSTMVAVRQSAEDGGPRWQRYFDIMNRGWEGALGELKAYMDREAERTRR